MHMPSARARRVATAAIAMLSLGSGMAARADILTASVSGGFEASFILPDAKGQYFEVGPAGTAGVFTPNLHDGQVTLRASVTEGSVGEIVTRTDFECPAERPNPVLYIGVTGPRSEADVSAHISGTSTDPTGAPIVYEQDLNQSTGAVSTFSETQLFKHCSE